MTKRKKARASRARRATAVDRAQPTLAERETEEQTIRGALEPELPLDPDTEGEVFDPDVLETMNDTQTLAEDLPADRRIVGPEPADRRRGTVLTGGDVDAAWDDAAGGEESVGGSTPTPDQDVVDDLGRAAGVTYADTEPLRIGDKEQARDDERTELDPASSEDYAERERERRRPKTKRPERSRNP